jgi:hypothetical protein
MPKKEIVYNVLIEEEYKGSIKIKTDLDPNSQEFNDLVDERVGDGNADWWNSKILITAIHGDKVNKKGEVDDYRIQCREYFPITSVSRADLEQEGFDMKDVDDSTMERLASKMGDAHCDGGYWIDLKISAGGSEIPKKGGKNG